MAASWGEALDMLTTRRFVIILLVLLFGGCAHWARTLTSSLRDHLAGPATIRSCAELFTAAERRVDAAGVIDSEAARIPGFPYLRVNRFLSDFRNEVVGPGFDAWVDRMQQLAMQGWRVELANVTAPDRRVLETSIGAVPPADEGLARRLRDCADLLRRTDLNESRERAVLRDRAVVPAEYRAWQRVVGLYPLTALLFRVGIGRWHDEVRATYAQPMASLPVDGTLLRYRPAVDAGPVRSQEIARILEEASANALKIPQPTGADRERLFAAFAPLFEIDVVSDDDRIGAPRWGESDLPHIDTRRPTVYRHLSHTRVGRQVLLQLNYTIWFPARPRTSPFDLLGGHLDGITWRVTLLPDGRPWVYDAIHNCGCYHLFFPTQNAQPLPRKMTLAEPAFMPQQLLTMKEGDRPVLRIAHTTHYIQRVQFNVPERVGQATAYRWESADVLRSLPKPDGSRRSLFREDGIVAGSERRERFFFWPMGVPEPGAMRQWGHHATAFVGRRYFDDARLFEPLFGIDDR